MYNSHLEKKARQYIPKNFIVHIVWREEKKGGGTDYSVSLGWIETVRQGNKTCFKTS